MLTRAQRLIVLLLVLVPIVVMTIWMASYVSRELRRASRNLTPVVVDELAQYLGREVKIGSVRLAGPGTVVAENVRISEGPTFATGTLLSAKRIVVHYSSRDLLHGQGAASVSSVEVIGPTVLLVRRRNGTFNVSDLLKRRPGPPRAPFSGTITIRGGTAVYRDYLAKVPHPPATATLRDLSAVIDAAGAPNYTFRIAATGGRGQFAALRVSGSYSSAAKLIQLDASAQGVSAPFAAAFAPFLGGIQLSSGTLRPNLTITSRQAQTKWVTTVAGIIGVRDAVVRMPGMAEPARQVSGNVVLARNRAALSLSGSFAGSPIKVTGTVSNFEKPLLDVVTRSPRAQFSRLVGSVTFLRGLRGIGIRGAGPVTARVTGPPSNPTVAVAAKIPSVSYQGYLARDVSVSAVYRSGRVTITSARGTVAGGTVAASGTIATRGVPALSIQGQAVGIDISQIRIPIGERAAGTASVQFVITGTTSSPVVTASVSIGRGAVRGVAFAAPSTRVTYAQGRLVAVSRIVVRIAGGVVRLAGTFTPARIEARYTAEGLSLAELGKLVGQSGLSGVLYSSGRLSGPVTDPLVTGTLEVFKGSYQDLKTDYARVAFSGNRRSVTVSQGTVRLLPAEFTFSGSASGLQTRRIVFAGDVHAQRLRVEQVTAMLGRDVDVTGTVAGDFTVSGTYLAKRPEGVSPLSGAVASGSLRLEDATAFDYPISNAAATLAFSDNLLTLSETTITSQGATLTVGGTVSAATRAVDLDFKLSDFDLTRLRDRLGRVVTAGGTAGANGSVTGTLDEPVLSASASISGLLVNNVRFNEATASAVYSDGVVSSFAARVTRGDQLYELQATGVNPATRCLDSSSLTVQSASIPDLWNLFSSSPYLETESAESARQALRSAPRITSGTLNGTVRLNGCLDNPDGSGRLVAQNVGIDGRTIDSAVVDASSMGGVVMLNELRVTSGDLLVEGTPIEPKTPVYKDGRIEASVSAYNLDLSRLSPWLGENTPTGVLTARFDVVGPAQRPDVIGSVEVVNPGYHGIVFDRLRASRIEVVDAEVRIADVILAANGHQVIAHGTVPWSWDQMTIPKDQQINLTAELQREDLSILSTFAQQIDPATTKGPIQAALDVTGTLADPKLSGVVQIQNGSVGIKSFGNTFTNVNADLVLDGKRVLVNQLSVQSSLGGGVQVVPGGYVDIGSSLQDSGVNVLLNAKGLAVSERNFLGYQEDVVIHVDAGLAVTRNLASPLITDKQIDSTAGGITIYDSELAFVVPESAPRVAPRQFAVNPQFDIPIDIGRDVTVKPPRMTLVVGGSGMATGTLERPDIRLDLDVQRGNLALGTTALRVTPGGTIHVTYAPPAAPELSLRGFQATTWVMATNPLGQRERYQITIAVSGSVEHMQINLISNPPGLSREQMLAALGHVEGLFATAEGTLQQELANVLTAVGTSTLFAPIERLFVERLGFEQFTLEYNVSAPLSLFVSRQLFGGLYVSYFQRLSGELVGADRVSYQLELSYRFKRLYHISFGVDDQQTSTIEVGYQRAFW